MITQKFFSRKDFLRFSFSGYLFSLNQLKGNASSTPKPKYEIGDRFLIQFGDYPGFDTPCYNYRVLEIVGYAWGLTESLSEPERGLNDYSYFALIYTDKTNIIYEPEIYLDEDLQALHLFKYLGNFSISQRKLV